MMTEDEKKIQTATHSQRPLRVGFCDSGLGGFTVLRYFMDAFPWMDCVYYGDNARAPYGDLSLTQLQKYAGELRDFFLRQKVDAIVVACNTISSNALDIMKDHFPFPVIGTILPGAKGAVDAWLALQGEDPAKADMIGVIATSKTVQSHAYREAIHAIHPDLKVQELACPLFVPAIEGRKQGEPLLPLVHRQLSSWKSSCPPVVVMGCTHYPIIEQELQQVLGSSVVLINPAHWMLEAFVREWKRAFGSHPDRQLPPFERDHRTVEIYTSGDAHAIKKAALHLLPLGPATRFSFHSQPLSH